jgi:hypothetical protein
VSWYKRKGNEIYIFQLKPVPLLPTLVTQTRQLMMQLAAAGAAGCRLHRFLPGKRNVCTPGDAMCRDASTVVMCARITCARSSIAMPIALQNMGRITSVTVCKCRQRQQSLRMRL